MHKSELVKAISDKSGLTRKETGKALDAVVASISEALCRNEKVSLIGFGTFENRFRKQSNGFNPATREPITIPARYTPAFRPSKVLKDAVKQNLVEE